MSSNVVGATLGNEGEYKMGAPEQPKQDIKFHDRLDLLLHTDDYVDPKCGTVSASDGQKRYCCNQCPTLKTDVVAGMV